MINLANLLGWKKKFLIFGCGFSGSFFAKRIRELGCTALTSSRSAKKDPNNFVFNSENYKIPNEKIFEGVTHILSCIPPDKNGNDPVLKILQNKFQDQIDIINDDILNIDETLLFKKNVIVFGNLPYNISTKILAKLLVPSDRKKNWEELLLMFQLEVANRIVAKPNTKQYGRLSLFSQFYSFA